jgi:dATP pyrophosphohydrolase
VREKAGPVGRAGGWKRPESVLVVVHTPRLDCLVLRRVSPAGFWQSVTGALEWGETGAEAARREVREETGLSPDRLEPAGVARRFRILPAWRHRYAPGVTHNVEHWWYLEVPVPLPVRLEPGEHDAAEWLPLAAAAARVSSVTNREAILALAAGAGES